MRYFNKAASKKKQTYTRFKYPPLKGNTIIFLTPPPNPHLLHVGYMWALNSISYFEVVYMFLMVYFQKHFQINHSQNFNVYKCWKDGELEEWNNADLNS